MKYKISQYTHITYNNKDVILFNSLSSKILFLEGFLKNIKDKNNIINNIVNNKKLFYILEEQKFIVKSEIDERNLGKIKYNETVMEDWLRLTILPTLQCNFRCTYCYEEHISCKLSDDIIEGLLYFIEENISGKKGISIDWFGGEPLLEMKTIEYISKNVIQLCKNRKIMYVASMTTNGYLLDVNTFSYLRKYKINQFQITIDGLKNTHNKNRFLINGSDTYDTIINNLVEIKQKIKSGSFKIIIRTNITKEILSNFEKYIDILKTLFGNDDRFSFLFRPVGNWGGEAIKNIESELISDINKIYLTIYENTKNLNLSPHYYLIKSGICQAGYSNSFVVKPDGTICKCTMLLDDPINKIGKISSINEYYIDQEKHLKWFKLEDRQFLICSKCSMFGCCCGVQCPASNIRGKHTCGYDYSNLDVTLKMLVYSQKKYDGIERIKLDL